MRSIQLNEAQFFSMYKQAQIEAPKEACGLLAGLDGIVKMVIPVHNISANNRRFEMDPRAQLRAFQLIEAEKLELLGIYHSHPKGPSHPSESDIRENHYDVIHLVISKAGRKWMTKAYILGETDYSEASMIERS